MKIEISLNEITGDWWFDFGISYCKTMLNKKNVITISIVFFSIYIRF